MGLKFYRSTGGTVGWYSPPTGGVPVRYSVDGGATWVKALRLNFFDPVSQTWQKGAWAVQPPGTIVSPTVAFTWTGSSYTAAASWSTVVNSGFFQTLEVRTYVGATLISTNSVPYSSLNTAGATTTYSIGAISQIGYTEMRWEFRIIDSTGQSGAWATTPTYRVPPSPVVSLTADAVVDGVKHNARATWSPPSGTVGSYRVTWNKNGGTNTVINNATSPTTITTGATDGGSTYNFTVVMIDPAGTASPERTASIVLPPNQPTNVTLSGMDTLTATLSWGAPTNGTRTGYQYRFSTDGGSTYGSWTAVGTGTLSATRSISGVNSLHAQVETLNTPSNPSDSLPVTVSSTVQPPTPTVTSITAVNNSKIQFNWSVSSNVNISHYIIEANVNGSGWYVVNNNYSLQSNNIAVTASLNNNTSQQARVTAVGYSGATATATGTFTSPSTVASVSTRFTAGKPVVTWTPLAPNTGYTIAVLRTSDGTQFESATVGAVGTWSSQSNIYAEWGTYQVVVTGSSASGTAASRTSNNARKLPNPVEIEAIESATYTTSGRRTNMGLDAIQGYSASAEALNYGAYFYGDRFADYLSATANGYTVTITSASIFLIRGASGLGGAVIPRMWQHNKGSTLEGNPASSFIGGTNLTTGIARDSYGHNDFSAAGILHWIGQLRDQTNGSKGLGFHHPNATEFGTIGTSAEYMRFLSFDTNSEEGFSGTVTVYHDG